MDLWAADSHVHFHKCFDEGLFFDNSFDNLRKSDTTEIKSGILFFTEGKNEDYFNQLSRKSKIRSTKSKLVEYSIDNSLGENTLKLNDITTGAHLLLISGYQIVTKENLEVLSLGTKKRINDGYSIENTISDVQLSGGIAVLPWGFGKWLGHRGKKIDELIRKNISHLFLGDNGGRTSLLPFPVQFSDAVSLGIKILPGTDPLPFKSEVSRPLTYGFKFRADVDKADPWPSIKNIMLDPKFNFEKFGHLVSPISFIKTQIAMQIKKRSTK
ncbi:MAG: hypothetical protein HXY50_01735 [Ignavibacteriaceae bacterium]|nr:hypothetical protein [Ignavibacteriaceae bacterium]